MVVSNRGYSNIVGNWRVLLLLVENVDGIKK